METLEHENFRKEYTEELAAIQEKAKEDGLVINGVDVAVHEDYKAEAVILAIGNKQLYMTVGQARDLALEIRKASCLIERSKIERGAIKGKDKSSRRRRR